MRGYHKKSPSSKCAMKVDLMKAYDNVRWDFLFDVLKAMSFPTRMIHWIRACVTSATFSICINGSLHGHFQGARGLRQGDPMSLYLFVIVMEILARIFNETSQNPQLKSHWRCGKNRIVNLYFADNLMVFCKGHVPSVQLIKTGLIEFQSLSGLALNPQKSRGFFSRCDDSLRNDILRITQFQEGHVPVKYLGVRLIPTRLKAIDCQSLVTRISVRI